MARLYAAPFSIRVHSAALLLLVDLTMLLIYLGVHLLKVWISLIQLLKCGLLSLFNLAASSLWASWIWNHSQEKWVVTPCCWSFLTVNISLIGLYGRVCPVRLPGNGHKNETMSVFNRWAQPITQNYLDWMTCEPHVLLHAALLKHMCAVIMLSEDFFHSLLAGFGLFYELHKG